MNPIEAGIGPLLDLDRDFVGGDALRAVRDDGPARRTVGLVCDGEPFPPMERHWPVDDGGRRAGRASPAGRSTRSRSSGTSPCASSTFGVDAADGLLVQAPDGPRRGEPHPTPFV